MCTSITGTEMEMFSSDFYVFSLSGKELFFLLHNNHPSKCNFSMAISFIPKIISGEMNYSIPADISMDYICGSHGGSAVYRLIAICWIYPLKLLAF